MRWKISNICVYIFFFLLQFVSCSSLDWVPMVHNRYVFTSAAAGTLVAFLLLLALWGTDTRKMSGSQSQRKGGSKKDVSSIIYLITFSSCQSSGAQSPNVFCEAVWNLFGFKHGLKDFSKQEWLCAFGQPFAEPHGSGNLYIWGGTNVFTRKPRVSSFLSVTLEGK